MKNFIVLLAFFSIGFLVVFVFQYTKVTTQHPTKKFVPTTRFSLENPPKNSIEGNIISMKGDIFWQSRTASESVKILDPQELKQGEAIETKLDSTLNFEFPGVVKVTALENSSLEFTQTIPDDFVVKMASGTVTFEKTGDKVPVSIRTGSLLIKLQAGKSLISKDPDIQTTTVEAIKGMTIVAFNDSTYTSNVVDLKQGQKFVFDNTGKTYTLR